MISSILSQYGVAKTNKLGRDVGGSGGFRIRCRSEKDRDAVCDFMEGSL